MFLTAIHNAEYLLHVIVILMWLQLQLKQKKLIVVP